jgi:hypothetical protein
MKQLTDTTGSATGWLERRAYPDLHPEAERALRAAALCWHEEEEAERYLEQARALASEHVAVLIAHYRFRLYKHRFQAAREAAGQCLVAAARRLGLPSDYTQVTQELARSVGEEADGRFWLFTLQAYGYVSLRAGYSEEGRRALERLVELDVADQTKTRVLLQVMDAVRGAEE